MTTTSVTDPMAAVCALQQRIETLEQQLDGGKHTDSISIVVFSGELDRMLAAFTIATGAAACGMEASMFFTFWGTAALKRSGPQARGKTIGERMFGWMLPGGQANLKLSRLDFGGLGRRMMAREMKRKNAPSLAELVDIARETGVQISICEMSMSLMGIHRDEIIDYPDMNECGVASFLERATKSSATLFI